MTYRRDPEAVRWIRSGGSPGVVGERGESVLGTREVLSRRSTLGQWLHGAKTACRSTPTETRLLTALPLFVLRWNSPHHPLMASTAGEATAITSWEPYCSATALAGLLRPTRVKHKKHPPSALAIADRNVQVRTQTHCAPLFAM